MEQVIFWLKYNEVISDKESQTRKCDCGRYSVYIAIILLQVNIYLLRKYWQSGMSSRFYCLGNFLFRC